MTDESSPWEGVFSERQTEALQRGDAERAKAGDLEHAAAMLRELDDADSEVAALAADAGAATDEAERERLLEQAETLRQMNEKQRQYWRDLQAGKIDADGKRIVHRSGAAEGGGQRPFVSDTGREVHPDRLALDPISEYRRQRRGA